MRNHGPGISADFRPHIFDRFAQADATNARQKGGTGLGLSIVKQIVDRLGGEVVFADAPGGGTIFHVELPRWEDVAGMSIDLDPQPHPSRILLCEDDPDAAIALRGQLRQCGFATDIAHTAEDAVTCAEAAYYSAILVDLLLPDGDGISLILRLREISRYRDTPIVVISTDPGRGRADSRSTSLNVLDWLKKPVDFDRLMPMLARSGLHGASKRPRILHVDEGDIVARALGEIAEVVSVTSVVEARRAMKSGEFDLVVLDTTLATTPGTKLMPSLRDGKELAVPIVFFPGLGANRACTPEVQGGLTGPGASIDRLLAEVRARLELGLPPVAKVV